LAAFFKSHGVEIEWINDVLGKTYEQELVEDMLTLMSSFSNKLYGKRSAEMRKQRKLAKLATKEQGEDKEGLQDGDQAEQQAGHAPAQECRSRKVHLELGLEPEENGD
jgi:hypothetical protein